MYARGFARSLTPPAIAQTHPRCVSDVRPVAAIGDDRQHSLEHGWITRANITADATHRPVFSLYPCIFQDRGEETWVRHRPSARCAGCTTFPLLPASSSTSAHSHD